MEVQFGLFETELGIVAVWFGGEQRNILGLIVTKYESAN
jgi:hypothetical protein